MGYPPDVFIVVVDCLRSPATWPHDAPPQVMPNLANLGEECVTFDRAATVAPWTIPAHASILTGLYPWEHGTNYKARLDLAPTFRNLAVELRELGYSSVCISGNPLLDRTSGITRPFETSYSAKWWESIFRRGGLVPKGAEGTIQGASNGSAWNGSRTLSDSAAQLAARAALRYPIIPNVVNYVLEKARADGSTGVRPSPWIEESFSSWIASHRDSERLFGLVNLIDAHEPYLVPRSGHLSLGDWLGYVGVPQERSGFLTGNWKPSGMDLRRLRQLYLWAVLEADRRVGEICEVLRRAGRWDNSLVIFTSDHGQSFLERGMLFHGLSIDDSVVRVPLWLKLPGAKRKGAHVYRWVSLVDIAPAVSDVVGIVGWTDTSGQSLLRTIDEPRAQPVLTMNDGQGIHPAIRAWVPQTITERFDRVQLAAFEGSWKVMLDVATDHVEAELVRDGLPAIDQEGPETRTIRGTTVDRLRAIAARLRNSESRAQNPEVLQRLKAWGYS